jgi:ATP-dependent helicase HrpB
MAVLNYINTDFDYLNNISAAINDSIQETVASIDGFFKMNLYDIILFSTPENIKINLQLLKNQFSLPSGKLIDIDYESAQAPKISARIQELFGQVKNPTVLNGKIPMTVELLAPNYRPTQVTSQLEQFWQVSYFEIKKELKPRYPRHAWPDNPLVYIPLIKK